MAGTETENYTDDSFDSCTRSYSQDVSSASEDTSSDVHATSLQRLSEHLIVSDKCMANILKIKRLSLDLDTQLSKSPTFGIDELTLSGRRSSQSLLRYSRYSSDFDPESSAYIGDCSTIQYESYADTFEKSSQQETSSCNPSLTEGESEIQDTVVDDSSESDRSSLVATCHRIDMDVSKAHALQFVDASSSSYSRTVSESVEADDVTEAFGKIIFDIEDVPTKDEDETNAQMTFVTRKLHWLRQRPAKIPTTLSPRQNHQLVTGLENVDTGDLHTFCVNKLQRIAMRSVEQEHAKTVCTEGKPSQMSNVDEFGIPASVIMRLRLQNMTTRLLKDNIHDPAQCTSCGRVIGDIALHDFVASKKAVVGEKLTNERFDRHLATDVDALSAFGDLLWTISVAKATPTTAMIQLLHPLTNHGHPVCSQR